MSHSIPRNASIDGSAGPGGGAPPAVPRSPRAAWGLVWAAALVGILAWVVAADDGLAPRDLHLAPRLPALVLSAGALVALVRFNGRALRRGSVLALGLTLLVLAACAGLVLIGVGLALSASGRFQGEASLAAGIIAVVAAVFAGPVLGFVVLWRGRRSENRSALRAGIELGEALAVATWVVAALGWGAAASGAMRTGATPLHWAAREGHVRTARWLIAGGADPDAATREGQTPLFETVAGCPRTHRAAARRDEVVAALLAAGADPSAVTANGETPLLRAAYGRQPRLLVETLLAAGADPDHAGFDGTALHRAVRAGSAEVVEALLAAGASVDPRDPRGTTPLMQAVAIPRYQRSGAARPIVPGLLAAGAGLATTDAEGRTPLHWAAASADVESLDLLLAAGADRDRTDRHGRRPIDLLAPGARPLAYEPWILDEGQRTQARSRLGDPSR